jgi:3-isopropylmalate/(R)-2-methylmalate dehydratase small subunit
VPEKRIEQVKGRGCVLHGDDIDTDRIIPARYLRCVTFDGLGEHAFKDDREHAKGDHALDDERFEGASILIVGRNFGCGSSREHAPQALQRFGFDAFVGLSFAEIFFGNCIALGVPCVTLSEEDHAALRDAVHADPEHEIVVDLVSGHVHSRAGRHPAHKPEGARQQLLEGSWNATEVLREAGSDIEETAARLPYVEGFSQVQAPTGARSEA